MKRIDDVVIVVDADGDLITAVGVGDETTFHSLNAIKLQKVKKAAAEQQSVTFRYDLPPLTAGTSNYMEIFAALVAGAPRRTFLKEAPDELVLFLTEMG